MDFSSIDPIILIASLIVASTPILLAATGELIVEKSGVLNLGVEGMMIIGAISGFIVCVELNSPLLGLMGAALGGALLSIVFGVVTQILRANQVASGLALTMFGLGLASLLGHSYTGIKPPYLATPDIPFFSEIPILGKMLFQHDFVVYFSIISVCLVWYFFRATRFGLIIKAIGENQDSAHALGYNVIATRILTIFIGGCFAGLAGGYLSLVRVPQWTEGMTAGAGWIALALVVFSSWKPLRLFVGAYIFGGFTILQLNLQAIGIELSVALLSMTPYIVTIIALVIISSGKKQGGSSTPGSLGKVFMEAQ